MVDFQDALDKAIEMTKQKKFVLVQTRPNFDRPIILCTGMQTTIVQVEIFL